MDLVKSYSKHCDVLADLEAAVRQLKEALADEVPPAVCSVRSADRKGRVWAMSERLSDEQVRSMIAEYRAGTIGKELAERYGISLSSVRRVLRKHGGRLKTTNTL